MPVVAVVVPVVVVPGRSVYSKVHSAVVPSAYIRVHRYVLVYTIGMHHRQYMYILYLGIIEY